jgi:hypothetical protein
MLKPNSNPSSFLIRAQVNQDHVPAEARSWHTQTAPARNVTHYGDGVAGALARSAAMI